MDLCAVVLYAILNYKFDDDLTACNFRPPSPRHSLLPTRTLEFSLCVNAATANGNSTFWSYRAEIILPVFCSDVIIEVHPKWIHFIWHHSSRIHTESCERITSLSFRWPSPAKPSIKSQLWLRNLSPLMLFKLSFLTKVSTSPPTVPCELKLFVLSKLFQTAHCCRFVRETMETIGKQTIEP